MFTAIQHFLTVEIIFEESNSCSFSFIHKSNVEISCNIEIQTIVKGNQKFYIEFKQRCSCTDHTYILRTVTPAAGLHTTKRAHQPQMDRNDQTIKSRELVLLPGTLAARGLLCPQLYERSWGCSIMWVPET